MDITRFKGGKELQEALNQLPAKIERNVMRSALRQGANVILNQARQNVPVDDSDLKKSINVSTRARGGKATATLRAGDEKAFYAHFIEYGVKPHKIKARRRKTLAFEVDDGMAFPKTVNHPGARAQPFMRNALDDKSDEAIAAVAAQIRKVLSTKHGIDVPIPDTDDS
jgi:HK97 gp10 family phage protein